MSVLPIPKKKKKMEKNEETKVVFEAVPLFLGEQGK